MRPSAIALARAAGGRSRRVLGAVRLALSPLPKPFPQALTSRGTPRAVSSSSATGRTSRGYDCTIFATPARRSSWRPASNRGP